MDFSDPTGTQPTAGVPGGFGGLGGGGGGPGGFADYNNYGAGASSDMAIQSDSPTQPLGVHGVGVGLVLGRQFSVGQSASGDLRGVLVLAANRGGGGHGRELTGDDPAFGNKEEIDRLQRELDRLKENREFGKRMAKLKARLQNLRQRKSKKAPESNKMIIVPPGGLKPAPAIEPPEPLFEPELIPAPAF